MLFIFLLAARPAGAATVTSGATHSCAITSAGDARCWGTNTSGQLGDNSTTMRSTPVKVSSLTDATAITAGTSHTCALILGGTIKCWGLNTNGQLGDNSTTQRLVPTAVSGITNAIQVTAGTSHTCALLADLTARCWGLNTNGQLGDASNTQRLIPTAVSSLTSVTRIEAGASHTCALTGATVRCWGLNTNGQLGDNSTSASNVPVTTSGLSGITAISAGASHTCALSVTTTYCWGLNTNGQLGDNSTTQRLTPVSVGGLSTATAISAGAGHTCAIDSSPAVKCWGQGGSGQLGDGNASQSLTAVAASGIGAALAVSAGTSHTCAVSDAGPTRCWGLNTGNQLGDASTTQRNSPVPTPYLNGLARISAGSAHTCGMRVIGSVACTGDNTYGQLGDGTTYLGVTAYPLTIGGLTGVTTIGLGVNHSCAVLSGGQAQCWGLGTQGQVGDGTSTTRTSPVNASGFTTASQLSGGNQHSCGFATSGQAKCWGSDANGKLGNGAVTGTQASPYDLSTLTNAVAIATGGSHSCAVASGGQAKCWGLGTQGQIGDNGAADRTAPADVTSVSTATAVAAGNQHSCALLANTTVRCWGNNGNGQLGDNSTTQRNTSVAVSGLTGARNVEAGDYHSCAIVAGGAVKCWGSNANGQLGDGTNTESHIPVDVQGVTGAISLTAGGQHTCAALDDSKTYCWGYNNKGQLGEGSSNSQSFPTETDFVEPVIVLSGIAEGGITGDTTPTVNYSLIEQTTTNMECRVDGGTWEFCLNAPESYTVATPLAQGVHSISVRGTDYNQNVGMTTVTFNVGTPPPTVSIIAPTSGQAVSDSTPSVTFDVTGSEPLTSQCKVDAGAYAACSSPYTPSTLGEGSHTVTVQATDGFSGSSIAAVTFTVDTVNPAVSIVSPADGTTTADDTPSVSFNATDATAVTTECRIDAGAYGACTSPWTTSTLAEGSRTLIVRATDAAGNQSTAATTITVDKTAPAVSLSAPAAGSATSDTTPSASFSVTDATATTIECRVDAGAYGACTSPWTAATLADGAHTLTVRATDAAGNQGTGAVTITVDTANPAVSITSPAAAAVTADNTPSVSFNVTDATATTTECRIDAGTYGACSSAWTTTTLADGAHTLTVRATDAAGNQGTGAVTITVDTANPAVSITSPAAAAVTADNTPSVSFNVTDATATTTECRVDAGSYGACSSAWTTTTLADGAHTLTVRATDAAGNQGTGAVTITVDTANPAVSITSPAAAAVTADNTPSVSFNVTDATATTTECRIDAGTYGACSSAWTTTTLADGAHTLTVRATDAAGNQGTGAVTITVDTTSPAVSISAPAASSVTGDLTPDVSFSASDATATTHECKVDAGAYGACTSPWTAASLAAGNHTVTVRSTDAAGNQGTGAVTFYVDSTLPNLSISSPAPASTLSDNTPTLTFAATDDTAVGYECRIESGSFDPCTSPFTTTTLADGMRSVTVRATDAAGHVDSEILVLLIDTTAPTVSIVSPADGVVTSDNTPTVSFNVADATTSTTQCSVDAGAYGACTSPFTTAGLADGAHTVNVRATDAVGLQSTESVTINVDTIDPVVSITAPTAGAVTADTTPTASFNVTDASATTAECRVDVGSYGACSSPFTTAALADGAHTIFVRATDAAGHQHVGSVGFTVDTTAPAVTIISPLIAATLGDNTPDVIFSVLDATATTTECRVDSDSYGSCTSVWTAPTLSSGAHSVTVRATDAAGNQGTGAVSFTIDLTFPTVGISSPAFGSFTTDTTPTITFAATGVTLTYECRVDSGAWGACGSTTDFTATALSDGTHAIAVRVTDPLSRVATASVDVIVDTTLPAVAISSPAAAATLADTTPTITFVATDANALTVECRTDAGVFSACSSPYTTSTLADGAHSVTVRATDAAGNQRTTVRNFAIDTVAPVVVIDTPTDGAALTSATSAIGFSTTDASAVTHECRVDAGSFAACSSPYTTPALADGAHSVTVRATDAAGTQGSSTVNFTSDAPDPPPSVPPTTPPKPVPAAANLRAKQAKRKLNVVFSVFLPTSSTASCAAPVSVTAKIGRKTVKAGATMAGVGPNCVWKRTLKIPRGAKGKTTITAKFAGNALVLATSASAKLKVK